MTSEREQWVLARPDFYVVDQLRPFRPADVEDPSSRLCLAAAVNEWVDRGKQAGGCMVYAVRKNAVTGEWHKALANEGYLEEALRSLL